MPIDVACRCGKRFRAPDSLAGKQVKCPGCQSPLAIPAPDDSGSLFDDFSDLEAAAADASSASGLGLAGGSQIGGSLSSGGLPGGSLQMGGYGRKKSFPVVPVAIGGTVAAIVLIVGLVLLLGGDASTPDSAERDRETEESSGGSDQPVELVAASSNSPEDDGDDEKAAGTPAEDASASRRASSGAASSRPSRPGNEEAGRDRGSSGRAGRGTAGGRGRGPRGIGPRPGGPPGRGTSGSDGGQSSGNSDGPEKHRSLPVYAEFPKSAADKWYAKSKKLVASRRPTDRAEEQVELAYSWMIELLPHLGHQADYDKWDLEEGWYEGENEKLHMTVVKEFVNPEAESDRYLGSLFTGMGLTHMLGMSGLEDGRLEVAARFPRSDDRAGIFGYDEIMKPREVTDGLSNTLMLIGSGKLAGPWLTGGGSTTRGARPPNYFHRTIGFGTINEKEREGALVVMADGSVKWLKGDVDHEVFRAMCTGHNGEPGLRAALERPPRTTIPAFVRGSAQPDEEPPAN